MVLSFRASEKDNGRKVYYILRNDLNISATLLRRMKQSDSIRINGEPCFTDRLISEGDILTADISSAEPQSDIIPESGDIRVLYENEGLLAVNKPSGVLVHPSHSKNEHTLSNYTAGYLAEKGEVPVCHAVNRLDRDTSGVVLFAKNTYFKAILSDSLGDMEKCYAALVYGKMSGKGTVSFPIKRESEGNMKRIVAPDGAVSITHYESVATHTICGEEVTLLRLKLETGRTHQIRVHLSHLGYPIIGDGLYCSADSAAFSEKIGISAQLLHAESLTFTEPISKKRITVSAPCDRFSENYLSVFLRYFKKTVDF